jgi:hypothetical protein
MQENKEKRNGGAYTATHISYKDGRKKTEMQCRVLHLWESAMLEKSSRFPRRTSSHSILIETKNSNSHKRETVSAILTLAVPEEKQQKGAEFELKNALKFASAVREVPINPHN